MAAAAPPAQNANNAKPALQAAATTTGCKAKTGPKDDLVTCEEESAAAIKAGKGDDTVTVTAVGVVSVIGTKTVIAIDGEDGADFILNLGTVNAAAVSAGFGLGSGVLLSTSKDGSTATGIAGGGGADRIDNRGTINVGAVAITGEIDAGLSAPSKPSPPKDGSALAQSNATGIAGGEDNDDLSNSGVINSVATALTQSLTLQLSANGSAEADSTSKAQSEAVGIDGESGDDTATNIGDINAVATSTAHGLSVSVAPSGNSPSSKESWTGGPEAEATAIGIRTGSGEDDLVNRGSVDAVATAVGGSAAVVALADEVASTGAASKSVSNATALAAGGGGDGIDNTGTLSAISTATSVGVELAINSDSDDEAASEGGTIAEANATGISGDGGDPAKATGTVLRLTPNRLTLTHTTSEVPVGGDDEIRNRGAITAVATAVSGESSAGVGIGGTGASDVSATASSNARAIDAGAGDDFIDNAGELTAVSTAVAAGIEATVSVNPSEDDLEESPDLKPLFEDNEAKAGGGVTATAEATGIGADSGGEATRTAYALDISGAGLSIRASSEVDSASGADEIRNTGAITAVATAVGGSLSASVGVNDAANVDIATAAKSRATGIAMGGGDDTLRNAGQITAVSTATADGREAAVSIEDDAKVAAEAGTTAEATAIGISADGGGDDTRREGSLVIAPTGLTIHLLDEKSGSSGADKIGNSGAVTAVATAVSGELSAPVSIGGSASGTAKSTATSVAAALEAGSGDDAIVNSGDMVAVATSTASAIQVSVAVKGSGDGDEPPESPAEAAESAKSSAETSVTATATATGINADDDDQDTRSQFDLAIDASGLHTQLVREKRAAGGVDTLDNSGNITAVATALSGSIAVPVGIEGDANADTTSTATASAMGVNAGDGSDRLGNAGTVTAVATATAAGLAVSVSTKGDAEVAAETGTTAEATATGISSDGASRSELIEAELDITAAGLHVSARQEDIAASGNDQITNTGAVTAVATALSGEGSVAVSLDGAAKADAKTTATSTATGIDAGAGDDVLTNEGTLTAVASSVALPLSVQVATKGDATSDFSLSDSSGAAKATATGINADGTLESRTREAHLDIDFTPLALDTGFERAEIGATGDDTITNRAAVTAVATAAMPAVDVAVSTKGYAAALSTAEAEATATGIDAGAGDDVLVNEGALDAIATAAAAAINVGVSTKSNALSADTIWNGGTKATATATGIDGDGKLGESRDALDVSLSSAGAHIAYTNDASAATGNDTITNTALVNAVATAASGSANVSVGKSGVSAAVSQSTSVADATGINAGAGGDTVTNTGVINATAVSAATAAAVTVTKSGVAVAGNAIWDGGVVAESTATGIDADGALTSQHEEVRFDFTRQDFEDDAGSQREFLVTLAGESSTTIATGDDTITNHGAIAATAVAEAPAIAVGVTSASGMAAALSTARADAQALGVIGGDGSDTINNVGAITSTAVADAFAVNAAVTKSGVSISADALSDGGTTAVANAVGIDADGEGVSLSSERSIEARHRVNLDDGSQEDVIRLEGHEREFAATGDDTVDNTGAIVATAVAITRPLGVAVTKSGVAVAASTSTSQAFAAGIDAGAGDDVVDNAAVIEAAAVSVAAATSVALSQTGATLAGNTAWDAGVTATADAVGIDGDGAGQDLESARLIEVTRERVVLERSSDVIAAGGDDRITNTGAVVASAIAEAPALAVAATGTGVAAASATATAAARSVAVDAGDGADTVLNAGALVSTAVANANALNVSVARTGGALASDAIFDGGARAIAESIGIAGDGDGENASSSGAIVITADGVALTSEDRTTSANGADLLVNDGTIVSTAVAAAPSAAVAVTTTTGAAAAITTASADARSAAIDAGGGDDDITNRGALVSTAVGNADTVSVAVASTGVAASGNSFWDGGVTATSEAVGIDADGTGRDTFVERSLVLDAAGVHVAERTEDTVASGDDEVTNSGDIVATAVSLTPSLNVAVAPTGVAAAIATATAGSRAVGIGGGAGDDGLTSAGTVTATAVAGALAANVAFTTSGGGAVTADALFSGGTTATAEAIGIDGDGEGTDFTSLAEADIGAGELSIRGGESRTGATGTDRIQNDGTVTATSVATAGSLGVAVTPAGLAAAITAATAESRAAALDGGSGSDEIDNSGELASTAVANADTISVAVTPAGAAVAGNAIWDGGATAGSEAVGIAGDGAGVDFGFETSATFDANGRRFNFESATLTAAGDEVITNDGGITATAVSVTPSLGVAVAPAGVAAAVSRATAESRAAAIDAGGGDDDVINTGTLDANATSVAVAGNVSFAGAGGAVAADAIFDGGTTANAEAVGIDTDGTGIDLETSASLAADDTGTHIRFGHSRQSALGDDTLSNEGDVTATAVAVAPSVAVSITPVGLAGAITTATAEARAAAIDTGGGDDDITNTGDLTATSVANADTVSVAVTPGGGAVAANALWNGGVTAEAEAVGIDADGTGSDFELTTSLEQRGLLGTFELEMTRTNEGGNDIVQNEGDIAVSAVAVTPSIGVAVAPAGVSVAASTATSNARAVSIDTGPGDDEVYNSGDLSADATSVAVAVNVSVAPAGGAVAANDVWDGGVNADARALGIRTDGGASRTVSLTMTNEGLGSFTSVEDYISFSDIEVAATGDDLVVNDGAIDATATAVAPAATVSVAVFGLSASLSTATASSEALGIETGGGEDTIDNSGDINATATSVATAVNVAVTVGGVAGAGDAVWDGGTTAIADATAIDAGEDADQIVNDAALTSRAVAVAPSVSVPVGIFGVALATSTATADAEARGILGGGGDDTIDNSGHIDASSLANATAVSIPVNIFGVAAGTNDVWDGGVESHASAVGIAADAGEDTISNSGLVEASAVAVTPSVTVPFTVGGVALATSTSTATSDAQGIRAGAGDDVIDNDAEVRASADATAVTVGAAIAVFGVAGTSDSVWNGGTTADAFADGIAGEDGADVIGNHAVIDAYAIARANSDQIAATLIGVAGSISTSTATTGAAALDGGAGDDSIVNTAAIRAEADARATSVAVAVSGIGAAVAADAFWDGGTSATSSGYGIAGGDGDDVLHNVGRIESVSGADSDSVGVAASLGIVTGATASSNATADSFGISGDAGIDEIVNAGEVIVTADADAGAVGVSALGIGAAFSGSFVDDVTVAGASATGLSGGEGEDLLIATEDSSLDVSATGSTKDTDVAVVATIGFADADASAIALGNASGLEGGDGDDVIAIAGEVSVDATANALARSVGWATLAVGRAAAGSSSEAVARGAGGGDGDDIILQDAILSADATATTVGRTISVAGTGFTTGDVESLATATVDGLAGDAGDDLLTNTNTVNATSTADLTARSFTLAAIGAAVVNGNSMSTATAAGMEGGDGDDQLVSEGSLVAEADSVARAQGTTLNLIGAASSDVAIESLANAAGMDGGAGDDLLINTASLDAAANAQVFARSFGLSGVGAAFVSGESTAASASVGMDGGEGEDEILNSGSIHSTAESIARAQGTSLLLGGASSSETGVHAIASAWGLRGGADADVIINEDVLATSARSESSLTGINWTLGGATGLDGLAGAAAAATGIDGGAGIDAILNTGSITVDARTNLRSSGSSNVIFGAPSALGTLESTLFVAGIAAGADDDEIVNGGAVSLTALSTLNSDTASWVIGGAAGARAGMESDATGIALDGGAGNDFIINDGPVGIVLDFDGLIEASSWTLVGGASDAGSYATTQLAIGLAGGEGDDRLENLGSISASTSSDLMVSGGSTALFGNANGQAAVVSSASAVGLAGGAGANELLNFDLVNLDARAQMTAESVAFTFAGGASASAELRADAEAAGMAGGSEADDFYNDGDFTVRATADVTSTGGTRTTFGDTSVEAATTAAAHATGIAAEGGDDVVYNEGAFTVIATANPTATSATNAGGLLQIDGVTLSRADANAQASGVSLGDGTNVLLNQGELRVVSRGGGDTDASSVAGSVTTSSATSVATGETIAAQARGVLAGDGSNTISNEGRIEVSIENALDASAQADGTGLIEGNAGANASVRLDAASAVGIDTGHGVNIVDNDGVLLVSADPFVDSTSNGRANGINIFDPANSVADAASNANETLAIGIRAGDGDNVISNDGAISVTAAPEAHSFTQATFTGVVDLALDSFATSKSSAGDARAYGILAGDGANYIRNTGSLTVTSAPSASSIARAFGRGWDGDAEARATSAVDNALAAGIFAGDGGNVIVNEGTLVVRSAPAATAAVLAEPGLGEVDEAVNQVTQRICSWQPRFFTFLGRFLQLVCENVIVPIVDTVVNEGEVVREVTELTAGAQAYGIWTGSGDDLIVNTGLIDAAVSVNGTSSLGVGIRAGAGDDEVRFGDGSEVLGHVRLEEGADTLALWGASAVSGLTDAGTGVDALEMYGAGSFAGALANFETAVKREAGTFIVQSALPTLDSITVFDGTLELAGSYAMGVNSHFMARINADGSHGQFVVGGGLDLAGTMTVATNDTLFVDGSRYDVIAASDIDGAFSSYDLPETPMLSFAVEQSDTNVDVVVSVETFESFLAADDPMRQSLGGYLDDLTKSATGDLATMLTLLQHSDDAATVSETLATLAPSNRESTVSASLAAIRRSQDVVQERLAAIRADSTGATRLGGDSPVNLFAGNGWQPGKVGGLWVATLSYSGEQPADASGGFETENWHFGGGVDVAVGDRYVVGGSLFAGYSGLAQGRQNDVSELESVLGSVYGSWVSDAGYYAQGVVSAGPADYHAFRHLDSAFVRRLVESEHSGDVFATSLEAGRGFDHGFMESEWFGAFNYVALTEQAFEETGAGALGFAIRQAETQSLISELGLRSTFAFDRPWGSIRSRLSLAWLHEHDVGTDTLRGHLLGAPDTLFMFAQDRADDDGYRFGMGLEVLGDEDGFFTVKWSEERIGRYSDSSVLAKFGLRF